MGQKLNFHKYCVVFCTFSVFILLKFLRVVHWGELRPTVALCLRPWRNAIVFKAPVLPVMVNGGRFER